MSASNFFSKNNPIKKEKQMKTKIYLTMAGLLALTSHGFANEADIPNPVATKLTCTIKSITPNLNNILSPGGFLQVGDTTEIDTTVNEITEINFSNGEALGLWRIKAKLTKTTPAGSGVTLFEGTKSTSQNTYTGILRTAANEKIGSAIIQVLRRRKALGTLLELGQANFDCIAK
jgi:hypothetical protein